MIKAVWKKDCYGSFSKLNAQSCYDELMIIANNNNSEIPNQEVVDYARSNPGSELHKAFNWNDAEAAEAFRRHTAKNLKNSLYTFELENPQVSISNNEEQKEIPLFLNPSSDTVKNHVPTEIVMSKTDLHKATLEKALRELQGFQQRYSFLKELSAVFQAINSINIP
jgi:hypothetical protein